MGAGPEAARSQAARPRVVWCGVAGDWTARAITGRMPVYTPTNGAMCACVARSQASDVTRLMDLLRQPPAAYWGERAALAWN